MSCDEIFNTRRLPWPTLMSFVFFFCLLLLRIDLLRWWRIEDSFLLLLLCVVLPPPFYLPHRNANDGSRSFNFFYSFPGLLAIQSLLFFPCLFWPDWRECVCRLLLLYFIYGSRSTEVALGFLTNDENAPVLCSASEAAWRRVESQQIRPRPLARGPWTGKLEGPSTRLDKPLRRSLVYGTPNL